MGMVLHVRVSGSAPSGASDTAAAQPGSLTSPIDVDLSRPYGQDFRAVDATLPPLSAARVHRVTLRIEEVDVEVAPGVRQRRWTYGGSVPGPTLHGRVGDTFVVTLVNGAAMGQSVDVHAGESVPDEVMRTWMGSAGHRANILKTSHARIGIGVAQGRDGLVWTQVFTG